MEEKIWLDEQELDAKDAQAKIILERFAADCKAIGCNSVAAIQVGEMQHNVFMFESPPTVSMVWAMGVINLGANLDGAVMGFLDYCETNSVDTSGSIVATTLAPIYEKMKVQQAANNGDAPKIILPAERKLILPAGK